MATCSQMQNFLGIPHHELNGPMSLVPMKNKTKFQLRALHYTGDSRAGDRLFRPDGSIQVTVDVERG